MPAVAAEPKYDPLGDTARAREAVLPSPEQRTTRYAKAAAKVGIGVVGLWALTSLAWSRLAPQGARQTGTLGAVSRDFAVHSFPNDCSQYIRYEGCKKKAWGCDSDDPAPTLEYKCCCNTDIWHAQTLTVGQPQSIRHSGDTVLRLQHSTGLCLSGPEDSDGKHFTFAPCDQKSTHLKLPPHGAGIVELSKKPGQCLAVDAVDSQLRKPKNLHDLKVARCNPASMQQMFQLTNGDKGMLQWSYGGNKCLDSEDDAPAAGSKIVLADCVYWPMKPTQVFVLEDAPEPVRKEEDHKKVVTHPSLFCASLMLPWSYEVDMLRSQYKQKVGIFQCDSWAVFSNERVKLFEGSVPDEDVYCDIMNGSLKAKIGGKFHTALNTPVFQRFWKRVMDDGRAWHHDWVIKVDPDCVFFPHRLKEMLANEYKPHGKPDAAVWLNNCQLGLHGPLEVFSKQALGAYKDSHGACDPVAEEHGQEDVFLRHCFSTLNLVKVDVFNLLLESEWACNERPSSVNHMPPCYDRQISFHPFKSVETYNNCYEKASKMHWSTPLYFNSVPPSPNNEHHA